MEWLSLSKRTNWLPSKPITREHTVTLLPSKGLKGYLPSIGIFLSGSLSLSKDETYSTPVHFPETLP